MIRFMTHKLWKPADIDTIMWQANNYFMMRYRNFCFHGFIQFRFDESIWNRSERQSECNNVILKLSFLSCTLIFFKMIRFLNFIIFGVLYQDSSAQSPKRDNHGNHHVQRRFFNEIFKTDSSFFKIRKSPKYGSNDFWICADGRKVLLTEILKGNVS